MAGVPSATVRFENSKGESRDIAGLDLRPFSLGVDTLVSYFLDESFGTLVFDVDSKGGPPPIILVNGQPASKTVRQLGDIRSLRVPLDRDLCFNRLALVVRPLYALTIDVTVEHRYRTTAGQIPKWSVATLAREMALLRGLVSRARLVQTVPDDENEGVSKVEDDPHGLLLQAIGRLSQAFSGTTATEANVDFHSMTAGDWDRDATLSELKGNPLRLTPQLNGCVQFKGRSYATDLGRRQLRSGRDVDFSEVVAVLLGCAGSLTRTDAPAIAVTLLTDLVDEIQFHFPLRSFGGESVGSVLERPMMSPFGTVIQGHLRTLVAISGRLVGRDPMAHGLFWLERSMIDWDAFQSSAFHLCAWGLGFGHDEIAASDGVLSDVGLVVADANTAKGMALFNATLQGWRAISLQPSGFRPDIFVIIRGHLVIIDAKFRMPGSADQVANPDGLKEVQAYMQEFGLQAAIVIAPRILNRAAVKSEGFALIEGRGHRIFVVEMQDSRDELTAEALRSAVMAAACL